MKSRNAFLLTACLLALLALAVFAVPALAQDETPPAEPSQLLLLRYCHTEEAPAETQSKSPVEGAGPRFRRGSATVKHRLKRWRRRG